MPFDNKLLAQARPSSTSTATLYAPNVISNIHTIVVCNTTGTDATYSIFWDNDGSTYDQSTALFYAVNLVANATDIIEFPLPLTMIDSSGNIGIQSGTSSALTYSLFGETKIG
jgi:hypothetical protein